MKTIDDRVLGSRIKKVRQSLGITQEYVGKAMGWEQSNVSKLEKGKRKKMNLDELAKLADILSVSVASLLPEWFDDGKGDEARAMSLFRRLPQSGHNMVIALLEGLVLRAERGMDVPDAELSVEDATNNG